MKPGKRATLNRWKNRGKAFFLGALIGLPIGAGTRIVIDSKRELRQMDADFRKSDKEHTEYKKRMQTLDKPYKYKREFLISTFQKKRYKEIHPGILREKLEGFRKKNKREPNEKELANIKKLADREAYTLSRMEAAEHFPPLR